MPQSNCNHPHGDHVNGWWLCGKCYTKFSSRPRTLRMVRANISGTGGDTLIQQTVAIPFSGGKVGLLNIFVMLLSTRLMVKTSGNMDRIQSIDYAIELLRGLEVEFGDEDFDWTIAGAWAIVDEDMQYWDQDRCASNS